MKDKKEVVDWLILREKIEKTGELDLSFQRLRKIPPEVCELVHLESLNLRNNDIRDLDNLASLERLEYLDISNNFIKDIEPIGNLRSLSRLNLSFNGISNIQVIKNLKFLEELLCQENQINRLPNLRELRNLMRLNIRSNSIGTINLKSDLDSITQIDIGDNNLKNLDFIHQLPNVEWLKADNNQIIDLPDFNSNIQLKSIDLSNNSIWDTNTFTKLKTLVYLDLRNNRIQTIEPLIDLLRNGLSISLLNHGYGLLINGNKIDKPPISILSKDARSVVNWFDQIKGQGEAPLFEAKILVLGQGGAGKTTFTRLQLQPDYKVQDNSEFATLGIDIHRNRAYDHVIPPYKGKDIKAHLWDFGGQNIQKMLHQFFITGDCLYVLLCDRRREDAGFDYWFQIINLLGPGSTVIVVENLIRVNNTHEVFALKKYQDLFPGLDIMSLEIDLSRIQDDYKHSWQFLNQNISRKLSELEIVNRLVPKKWSRVRDKLEKLKSEKYITTREFYQLCLKSEIGLEEEEAKLCLFYLKALGDIVYFEDKELCTYIFLDHEWLTRGVYYVLSDEEIQKSQGKFTKEQAYECWGTSYDIHEKDMLLLLLLKDQFDICYELKEKNIFITPLLIPDTKPLTWELETTIYFRFQYGFIPHGMFSRLIVRLHERIQGELLWKSGVRLIDAAVGERAEVQQYVDPDQNQQVIDIKINSTIGRGVNLLNFIRAGIEPLHREFRNLNVKEMVGCNCVKCQERVKKGKRPTFYDFEKLQRNLEHGRYFVDCDYEFKEQINIGSILADVVIKDAGEKTMDMRFMEELKNLGMTIDRSDRSIHISDFGKPNAYSSSDAKSESKAKAQATAKVQINIEIQNLLGDAEVLKRDIERELKIKKVPEEEIQFAISDVEMATEALAEMEAAESIDKVSPGSKSRLRSFFEDFSDEDSTIFKTLKMIRKGKDHGVRLAETYNSVAANLGMPLVPPAALDVIKAI